MGHRMAKVLVTDLKPLGVWVCVCVRVLASSKPCLHATREQLEGRNYLLTPRFPKVRCFTAGKARWSNSHPSRQEAVDELRGWARPGSEEH